MQILVLPFYAASGKAFIFNDFRLLPLCALMPFYKIIRVQLGYRFDMKKEEFEMANRNMEQIVKRVYQNDCIPNEYQLTITEMEQLHSILVTGKVFEALAMAFDYGFALGCRATRKGKTKKI